MNQNMDVISVTEWSCLVLVNAVMNCDEDHSNYEIPRVKSAAPSL